MKNQLTLTDGRVIDVLPPVKIYEHLIDHVNGFGERTWYQQDWLGSDFQIDADRDYTSAQIGEVCDTYACIAGEVLAMHGLATPDDIADYVSWPSAAEMFGVPQMMQTDQYYDDGNTDVVYGLFAGANTRDIVLTELHHRHEQALKESKP